MPDKSFSQTMSNWLGKKGRRTFGELENIFGEKSFAVAFLILMAPAALPLPTGGVTHVLEVITMLLSLEMIAGRRKIWSPKFWQQRNLGNGLTTKALLKLVKFVAWFEKHSRPRLIGLFDNSLFLRLIGLVVFFFSLSALVAIPFSGLDTLPALGVVIISLALILNDALIILVGLLAGLAGIALEIGFSSAIIHLLNR